MSRHEWIDQAVCATTLPDASWIEGGRADPALLAICIHSCPVRSDCARTALQIEREHPTGLTGIWAGVSVRHSDTRETAMSELLRIAQLDKRTAAI